MWQPLGLTNGVVVSCGHVGVVGVVLLWARVLVVFLKGGGWVFLGVVLAHVWGCRSVQFGGGDEDHGYVGVLPIHHMMMMTIVTRMRRA